VSVLFLQIRIDFVFEVKLYACQKHMNDYDCVCVCVILGSSGVVHGKKRSGGETRVS